MLLLIGYENLHHLPSHSGAQKFHALDALGVCFLQFPWAHFGVSFDLIS